MFPLPVGMRAIFRFGVVSAATADRAPNPMLRTPDIVETRAVRRETMPFMKLDATPVLS